MNDQPSLRERKKEQTRLDLIDAAIKLFKEKGYEATNVDDIVALANYSRSTFFRYFGTKEDVVFFDAPERLRSLLEPFVLADPEGDPWRQAREALTRQSLEFTAFAPELEAACIQLWRTEPSLQGRLSELILTTERQVALFFAERRGVDPPLDVEGQVMAAAMVGVLRVILSYPGADRRMIGEVLKRGFDLLEDGMPPERSKPRSQAPRR